MKHYIIVLAVLLAIIGCASHKEISSSERIRTEYIHQRDTILSHDSIHIHDSVFMTQRGDTFFQYKYRTEYRDRLVYRTHNDTVNRTDTVTKTLVTTEYIERKQSFLQKAISIIGTLFLCFLLAVAIVYVLRRFIR